MNTIILLNRTQTILMDIYTDYPTGMLPLLDRPAITYMLERLAQQGITKITLAVSNATIDTVATLGDGSQFGLELSYLNTDRDDDLRWFRGTRTGVFKIMDGNLALDAACNNYVKATHLFPAQDDNIENSVIYLHNVGYALQVIRSGTTRSYIPANPGIQLSKYHQQCHHILRDQYTNLTSNILEPASVGHSVIHTSSASCQQHVQGENVYVGKFCAIHRDSLIQDDVVIGSGCMVDRHVFMNNTVILPNTHVPAHYNLRNCLVSPDWVYNLVNKNFSFLVPTKLMVGSG